MFFVRLHQLSGYEHGLLSAFDNLLLTEAYSRGRSLAPVYVAERLRIDKWDAVKLLLDSAVAKVTTVRLKCPECGTATDAGDTQCGECGFEFSDDEDEMDMVFELYSPQARTPVAHGTQPHCE